MVERLSPKAATSIPDRSKHSLSSASNAQKTESGELEGVSNKILRDDELIINTSEQIEIVTSFD